MKRLRLIFVPLVAVALLAGCAHLSRPERNTLVQHCVPPSLTDRMVRGDVLTLSDIIELSQRNVPSRLIINYLYSTRAVYCLDKPGMARLNKAKVPQEVINYLLDTPNLFGPRPYAPRYYAGPYYEPYPWYGPYWGPYWGGPYYGTTVVVRSGWGGHRHCR